MLATHLAFWTEYPLRVPVSLEFCSSVKHCFLKKCVGTKFHFPDAMIVRLRVHLLCAVILTRIWRTDFHADYIYLWRLPLLVPFTPNWFEGDFLLTSLHFIPSLGFLWGTPEVPLHEPVLEELTFPRFVVEHLADFLPIFAIERQAVHCSCIQSLSHRGLRLRHSIHFSRDLQTVCECFNKCMSNSFFAWIFIFLH